MTNPFTITIGDYTIEQRADGEWQITDNNPELALIDVQPTPQPLEEFGYQANGPMIQDLVVGIVQQLPAYQLHQPEPTNLRDVLSDDEAEAAALALNAGFDTTAIGVRLKRFVELVRLARRRQS